MCSVVPIWGKILGARLCPESSPHLPPFFFSSTLFTFKFLPGLTLCSLLAVAFSYFRLSQPQVDRKSQALFPSFPYLNLGWWSTVLWKCSGECNYGADARWSVGLLYGGAHGIGATWWVRLNRPCAAAMRPCVILLATACSKKSLWTVQGCIGRDVHCRRWVDMVDRSELEAVNWTSTQCTTSAASTRAATCSSFSITSADVIAEQQRDAITRHVPPIATQSDTYT